MPPFFRPSLYYFTCVFLMYASILPLRTYCQDSSIVVDSAADSTIISMPMDSAAPDTTRDSTATKTVKDTVFYEADTIEYDISRKIILMRGNGVVKYHKMTLFADTIHFLFNEDMLVATGKPQLLEDNDTVAGEYMVYDLNSRRGKVRYGTAHSADSRYDGYEIARSDDKGFYIEDGAYTSCVQDDSSHYCFYGKHIKVIPNDKAISRPVVLNIADAPVIALPYYISPLEKGRRSGWLHPRWGGHITHGGHVDNIGYYWAPNDYSDFILAGKVTEFSSFVMESRARYALRYKLSGGIDARYAILRSYDTLNTLWGLDYTHNQNLLPDESMKLSGRGSIVSGKSFYKSVSEDTTELLNQQINANMQLTKSFSRINGYGSLTWNRTHNFKTNMIDQSLPSFSFNLNTRPLFPSNKENQTPTASNSDEDTDKWYNKITYSYRTSGNRKYSYNDDLGKKASLFDHSGLNQDISISAPQNLFKWFNMTPNFSMRHALFDAYIDTNTRWETQDSIVYDTTDWYPIDPVLGTIIKGSDTLYVWASDTVLDTFAVYDTISYKSPDYDFVKANTHSWNAGVSFSTKLYGVFPIKLFAFQGIRHTFTPSVSYTFYPEKELDRRFPDVGVSYDGKRERGQVVGFSFDNLFQGKTLSGKKENSKDEQPLENKFTIVSGRIGMSYDFEGKSRKWSDISLSAGVPNKLIDFSYNSTFTPYSDDNKIIVPKLMNYNINISPKFSGAGGSFWGGDFLILEGLKTEDYMQGYGDLKTPGWSLSLNPSYSFSRSRKTLADDFVTKRDYRLSTSARIKFTDIWSASWSSSYNFIENQFMNHSLNFSCDLECWDLRFDWYPSGFNQGYFYFIVKIKKHPDIKWVERS